MTLHSSSPALSQGHQSNTANSHSPYHVLAQLTAGLAECTKALTATHVEFVETQKSIYKTGAEISGLLSSVKTGIQVEELALDSVGDSANSYKNVEEAIIDTEPVKKGVNNNSGSNGHSSGRTRRSRATDNIYNANTNKIDFGSNESDPIIID